MEEPPQKVTKYEMESQYLEGEVMEETQEEWLSEGVLTDDDYNPASQQTEADQSDQNTTPSQDFNVTIASESADSQQMDGSSQEVQAQNHMGGANIEETLENFESSEQNGVSQSQETDLPAELSTFLTRKPPAKAEAAASDSDEPRPPDEDDGNDTDDLLRVLGDGQEQKDKDGVKRDGSSQPAASSDDDDEFVFQQGKSVKSYRAARAALRRGPPARARPEDDDVTDCSDNETPQVESTQLESTQPEINSKPIVQISSNVRPGKLTITPPSISKQPERKEVKIIRKPGMSLKQYTGTKKAATTAPVKIDKAKSAHSDEKKISLERSRTDLPESGAQKSAATKKQPQPIVKPETMEEETLSDMDSDDYEDSLYDELPTSGSEEEDWFTLDVRAERAGDYVPLMGEKAYQLLLEEKQRVSEKIKVLKQNLHSLTEAGKLQAEKVKKATSTAAELDAMLKAA